MNYISKLNNSIVTPTTTTSLKPLPTSFNILGNITIYLV